MSINKRISFPAEVDLGLGWERLPGIQGARAFSLYSQLSFSVTKTHMLGLVFDDSWLSSPVEQLLDLGRVQYRLAEQGGAFGQWRNVQIAEECLLTTRLERDTTYSVEVRIITPALAKQIAAGERVQQFSAAQADGVLTGSGHLLQGIITNRAGVIGAPVVVPASPLRAVVYASGSATHCESAQQSVTYPIQLLENIVRKVDEHDGLALMTVMYDSLVGPDYDYPFNGEANHTALRAAYPEIPPLFSQIFDHPYEGAAAVADAQFAADIVVYAIGDRDGATGLPVGDAPAYQAAIEANLAAIRTNWPTAHILVLTPPSEATAADIAVRAGITAAVTAVGDGNTTEIDMRTVSQAFNLDPDTDCPLAEDHRSLGIMDDDLATTLGLTLSPCDHLEIGGADLTINTGQLICLTS